MKLINYVAVAMASFGVSQGIARASDCNWQAAIVPPAQLSDFHILRVRGMCQEPSPGYMLTLNRVDLPQTDASTLTLVLDVVVPKEAEPQVVTPTPVEFRQAVVMPRPAPTKVTIREAATNTSTTIDVVRSN